VSSYFSEPSWQSAVVSLGGRGVPDLAANAEPNELVYTGGLWQFWGGTSIAAPLVAGIAADAEASCSTEFGNMAPRFYAALAADGYGTLLTDVTTGDNDWTRAFLGADFTAATGYDLASGLGTPIASGFLCPAITSVSSSAVDAGQSLTISGQRLTAGTTVIFGSTQAIVTSASATALTAIVPVGSGPVNLTVVSPMGASNVVVVDENAPPTLSVTGSLSVTATDSYQLALPLNIGGFPSPALSVSGLPSGLSFDQPSGEITGSPQAGSEGTYSLVVTATNALGSVQQGVTLNVGSPPTTTVTTATAKTTPTTTTSLVPHPVVAVSSLVDAVTGSKATVVVHCSSAACRGTVTLTTTRTVTLKHGRKLLRRKERVVLGRALWSAPSGTTRSLKITLTAAALRLLAAKSNTRAFRCTESITASGALTATRTVTLKAMPMRSKKKVPTRKG
jgi:hypothetical protein